MKSKKTRFELRIRENLIRDLKIKAAQEEMTVSDYIITLVLNNLAFETLDNRYNNILSEDDVYSTKVDDLFEEYF